MAEIEQLSEQQIEDYLKQHPRFFVNKDRLLKQMRIPHASGRAISLLERQNELFREEANLLDRRLSSLITNARDNDKLFNHLKSVVLHVISAEDVEELAGCLHSQLTQYFNVDEICLGMVSLGGHSKLIKALDSDALNKQMGLRDLTRPNKAVCGELSKESLQLLFKDSTVVKSAAVASLYHDKWLGVLSLGSHDAGYFRNSMDTLFLNYLSEVVSIRLSQLIK